MEDIEERAADSWEDIDVTTNVSIEWPDDNAGKAAVANALKQNSLRKETKKASAHMIRASKELLKKLIMEAGTPHEAWIAIKTKWSVSKKH